MKNQSVLSAIGVHNSDYIVVLFLEKQMMWNQNIFWQMKYVYIML